MLNSENNYPYPLLRNTTEDFLTTTFSDKVDVLREANGFRIVPHFSVNNDQINALIKDGVFSYAIQVQCKSTYYRTVEYIKDNNDFFIYGGLVHEMVELCPCIIAIQDLQDYCIDDFVPAFKLTKVRLFKNDVIGIGDNVRFRAYYKADEVKKASSVIEVQEDKNIDRIQINLNKPNIVVSLPKTQYEVYLRIGTSTSDQVTLLTGILSVPVIAIALNEIDEDDNSDYAGLPWYKSLRAQLDKMADGDPSKVSSLLENSLSTAQQMLGDNLSDSLRILDVREW